MSVSKIVVHPSYDANTIDNDIALWKLSTSIAESSTISYATLPAQGSDPAEGTTLTVSGWYVLFILLFRDLVLLGYIANHMTGDLHLRGDQLSQRPSDMLPFLLYRVPLVNLSMVLLQLQTICSVLLLPEKIPAMETVAVLSSIVARFFKGPYHGVKDAPRLVTLEFMKELAIMLTTLLPTAFKLQIGSLVNN